MDKLDVHRCLFAAITAASSIPAGVATAQAAAEPGQPARVEVLESIVVTARRREERLQDTPIAVTALSAEALERQQIIATTDLDKVAPNLQFHSYGTLTGNNSAAQVFIRGIGQTDATPAVDPGVGIYVDEVYMGRAVGAAMEFRDIANVQILRGPQGTLFGRNTIGGAVLLTTNGPGEDAGSSVRLGVGEDNLHELFGAIDLPINGRGQLDCRLVAANAMATSRACPTARISATRKCTRDRWRCAGNPRMP
jgi:iron complex outermembrane receptor protein